MDEEKAAAAYPEFARTLADFAAVPKKYPEIHREMMNILEPLGKAKLNREFARDLYGNILVASSQDGTREEIEKAYDSYDRLMFEIDRSNKRFDAVRIRVSARPTEITS